MENKILALQELEKLIIKKIQNRYPLYILFGWELCILHRTINENYPYMVGVVLCITIWIIATMYGDRVLFTKK